MIAADEAALTRIFRDQLVALFREHDLVAVTSGCNATSWVTSVLSGCFG